MSSHAITPDEHAVSDSEEGWHTDNETDDGLSFAKNDIVCQLASRPSMITRGLQQYHRSSKPGQACHTQRALPDHGRQDAADPQAVTSPVEANTDLSTGTKSKPTNSPTIQRDATTILSRKEVRQAILHKELPGQLLKNVLESRRSHRPGLVIGNEHIVHPHHSEHLQHQGGDAKAPRASDEFAPHNYHTRGW